MNTPGHSTSRSGSLVLTGYGLRLAVERGHLVAEDGVGTERRAARFSRVRPGFERVVVLGHAGTVSLEALRWLHELGIGLVHLGTDGEVVVASGPRELNRARLRRAQALAAYSEVGLSLSRELVRRKLEGQLGVLGEFPHSAAERTHVRACLETLPDAAHARDLRSLEASAARAYWHAWRDETVRFAAREVGRVPAHWTRFGSRASPLAAGGARRAVSPVNALLNYLYAILEAEARIALLALGLDPGLGLLHADQEMRDSLALDVMEPARPAVDRLVLGLIRGQVFRKADFFETREGVCRLMPPLTEQCAARSVALGHAVAPHAEWLAQQLGRARLPEMPAGRPPKAPPLPESRGHQVPTLLTQDRRRVAHGRPPKHRAVTPLAGPDGRRCTECGKPRSRESTGLCLRCLHRLAPGLTAARATVEKKLARGRALFSRASLASQGRKMTAHHAQRRAWSAAHPHPQPPSEAAYRRRILPALKHVTVAAIARATGMSMPYCSAVRAGRRVPHPVHWEMLQVLANAS